MPHRPCASAAAGHHGPGLASQETPPWLAAVIRDEFADDESGRQPALAAAAGAAAPAAAGCGGELIHVVFRRGPVGRDPAPDAA